MSAPGYTSPRDRERYETWTARHAGHVVVHGKRTRKCMTCRNGYSDVDTVAVDRAVAGRGLHGRLSVAEREEIVKRCRKQGVPAHDIATRARCHPRTVFRIAGRLGC